MDKLRTDPNFANWKQLMNEFDQATDPDIFRASTYTGSTFDGYETGMTNSEALMRLMPIELIMHYQRNLWFRFNRTPGMGHRFLFSSSYSTGDGFAWGFVAQVLEMTGAVAIGSAARQSLQAAVNDGRLIQTYDYHIIGSHTESWAHALDSITFTSQSKGGLIQTAEASFESAVRHNIQQMVKSLNSDQWIMKPTSLNGNIWSSRASGEIQEILTDIQTKFKNLDQSATNDLDSLLPSSDRFAGI